jgi:hypothetical protein
METEIIITFCVVDDYLKAIRFQDDIQAQMSSSEIITMAIVAGRFFGGNHEKIRSFFRDHRYVKHMLTKSQFCRRLHAIPGHIWENIHLTLAETFKQLNATQEYIVDSFPVPVCHNMRISRSKIYKEKKYRGFSASKRQYFYGIRVHMISTIKREPIEMIFAPGSVHDAKAFKAFDLDLPKGSILMGDAAYSNEQEEELLRNDGDITPYFAKKSNSKTPHSPALTFLIQRARKPIETTFSCITNLFPKKIHAVTQKGFELKIICFVLGYSISLL